MAPSGGDDNFNLLSQHRYQRLETPSSAARDDRDHDRHDHDDDHDDHDDFGDVELQGRVGVGRSAAVASSKSNRIDQSSSLDDDDDDDGDDDGDFDFDPLLSPDDDDDAASAGRTGRPPRPRVYPQRWIQLLVLSLLAMLSDWVCFSTASVPHAFASAYPGRTSEGLIDAFLLTNVLGCLAVTDVVARFGLRRCVVASSVMMTTGCWLRCGLGIFPAACDVLGVGRRRRRHRRPRDDPAYGVYGDSTLSNYVASILEYERSSDGRPLFGLPPYPFVLAGTVLVGLAQPFFQCTPPLLSATWFASDERATSSAVALNFNQVGIAAALVVGGRMVDNGGGDGGDGDAGVSRSRRDDEDDNEDEDDDDEDDNGRYRADDHGFGGRRGDRAAGGRNDDDGLARYFALVAVLSAFLCAGTCRNFRDSPPVPPSASEAGKAVGSSSRGAMPFHVSARGFFGKRGFGRPLAAFVFSIAITNVVGAFIEEVMERGGVTDRRAIAWAGCGFEMAIVLGGVILGRYVDRTKEYKSVTMWCIALSLIFVLPLGLTQHRLGQEPKLLVASLFLLGFFVGPVQPINAELAVDVTFPGDETAVESVQQFSGNLVSAMLVPVAGRAAKLDYQLLPSVPLLASDIRGDVVFMMALAIATICYYRSFDAPLRRSMADGH